MTTSDNKIRENQVSTEPGAVQAGSPAVAGVWHERQDRLGEDEGRDVARRPVYGVRYRDPHDPDQAMLDIELEPDSAPLLTMLTGRLSVRPRTLDELRDHALTETVYRPQVASREVV